MDLLRHYTSAYFRILYLYLMYKKPYFTVNDQESVVEFMYAHPFVTLVGSRDNTPVVTQVPVLIDDRGGKFVLRGHIMRKSDHHLAFGQNPEVLVLFNGPHSYVSASWYSMRGVGSTWNYMTVHARGKISLMDEAHTLQLLTDLTHKYEDNQSKPEILENMNMEEYVQPMIKAIASFEIELEDIYPLFKLSQNRDDESYKNIVAQLMSGEDIDGITIAGEMMKLRPHLFE
ncbi:Protease synthase and sporulation protein PAI 2 [Methylococcales bacterium]|nr:Protease synthase and sporulation protein PAI 2 [Methylococcales bacterium]